MELKLFKYNNNLKDENEITLTIPRKGKLYGLIEFNNSTNDGERGGYFISIDMYDPFFMENLEFDATIFYTSLGISREQVNNIYFKCFNRHVKFFQIFPEVDTIEDLKIFLLELEKFYFKNNRPVNEIF